MDGNHTSQVLLWGALVHDDLMEKGSACCLIFFSAACVAGVAVLAPFDVEGVCARLDELAEAERHDGQIVAFLRLETLFTALLKHVWQALSR